MINPTISIIPLGGEWEAPLLIGSLFVLMVTSLYSIHRIDTDLMSDLYNWFVVGLVSITFLQLYEGANTKTHLLTLFTALAIKKAWDCFKCFKNKKET